MSICFKKKGNYQFTSTNTSFLFKCIWTAHLTDKHSLFFEEIQEILAVSGMKCFMYQNLHHNYKIRIRYSFLTILIKYLGTKMELCHSYFSKSQNTLQI